MEVIKTVERMQAFSLKNRAQDKSIGFVPTMGALHQGHLELVKQAVGENDTVVCSIFVNPIQFNNLNDLKKYPRTLDKDLQLLSSVGCNTVFAPDVDEMYPEPVTKTYDFGMLDKVMEGRYRSGHFNGVAIVVKKLFDFVLPHSAYFGQKDFQQLAIIRELVKMENLDLNIVACPTIREADGLAMSSRNVRLTEEQRQHAPLIYRALKKASELYKTKPVQEVRDFVADTINQNPQMRLEYFEICHSRSLQFIGKSKPEEPVVACIAVHMGEVRLIDNIFLKL